jgi:hypothetical protein
MGDGCGERLIIAIFTGAAAGSLAMVTVAMILAGLDAVAVMPAHGYRIGGLLAGVVR